MGFVEPGGDVGRMEQVQNVGRHHAVKASVWFVEGDASGRQANLGPFGPGLKAPTRDLDDRRAHVDPEIARSRRESVREQASSETAGPTTELEHRRCAVERSVLDQARDNPAVVKGLGILEDPYPVVQRPSFDDT